MVLTLVLDKRQAEVWELAVEKAKDEVGGAKNPKARTLELLANHYVSDCQCANKGLQSEVAEPGRTS